MEIRIAAVACLVSLGEVLHRRTRIVRIGVQRRSHAVEPLGGPAGQRRDSRVIGCELPDQIDVPAHFACGLDDDVGVAHDGAHHDDVAAGVMQFFDRTVEVGVGRPVRRGGHHFQPQRLGFRHHPGQHVLAEVGILVRHAERLAPLGLCEILHRRPHLVVIRCELGEFQPVERLIHRPCRRQRKHVRHVLGELRRHVGIVHRCAAVVDGGEDIVVVEQLVHRLHRPRHLILVVLDDILDLAAVDATLCIGFVERHAHRVAVVHALHGGHTGQVGDRADDDFRVGHAADRVGGIGRGDDQQQTAGNKGQPAPFGLPTHRLFLP